MQMTTSEWAALIAKLAANAEIKRRFPQFWRVKRMDASELRRLARSVGIDVRPPRAVAHAIDRAAKPPEEVGAPFKGTFGFTLNIEAFGINTPRRARVVWEYTPEWPYYPPKGRMRIDGEEDCSFTVEVETVTQEEPFELPRGTEEALTVFEWQPLVLWGSGLVGEEVVDRIFERIDEAARAQNRARKAERNRAKAAEKVGPTLE